MKKSWLGESPSQLGGFIYLYVTLVIIAVMMTVVAVIAISVVRVVGRPRVVAVRSVIAIWIIAAVPVAVRIVSGSVTGISDSYSNSADSH
jgi:predicted PurR-regulated permease PerM